MASTLVQCLKAPDIRRRNYSQYSQGSVAGFATQFNIDWGSSIAGGQAISISAKAGAATVAEVVISPGLVLELNPGDFVGYNFQVWEVVPAAKMGRTVSDGATNTNTTVTSSTAAFTSADQFGIISGPGIPGGTTIQTVNSGTSVTITAAATATATGQPLTIIPPAALYVPDFI